MDSPSTIRVVIADDHPLVRVGVTATLKAFPEYQVVAQAQTGQEALEMVRSHRPDLLILDLGLGESQPARFLEQCAREHEPMKVLLLSGRCGPDDVLILDEFRVDGFVSKQEGPEHLLQAVRVVLNGESWFSHQVLQSLRKLREMRSQAPESPLTEREGQVLRAMMQAKDDLDIAQELLISRHTVRRYVTRIFQKLQVKNRMEAIVWASLNKF
jgi:two-component system invasion response regulator UvrY